MAPGLVDPDHGAVTRVFAVRHGETAWNVDGRIQGHLDIDLNDKGQWQARRLAWALRDEAPTAIYSSDLSRARQTALAIGEACGVAVQFDRRLRERSFGVFEGSTWAEISANWPAEHARWRARDPTFAPAGGESLRDFHARSVEACLALAGAHTGQTVVLVAHGGVMDGLYREAACLDLSAPRTWLLGNAAINRLLLTTEGLNLVGWADTSHLDNSVGDDAT